MIPRGSSQSWAHLVAPVYAGCYPLAFAVTAVVTLVVLRTRTATPEPATGHDAPDIGPAPATAARPPDIGRLVDAGQPGPGQPNPISAVQVIP